ncbi:MAG: inosine/xanthosine triphosphatase [Bacillota bacterium]
MKKIVVASHNPVKVDSARMAFEQMFPDETFEIEGVSVPSGVSDQPMTDTETFEGARNRLEVIQKERPNADHWVSFEGGVEDKDGEMEAFAWVLAADTSGRIGKGRTATFILPQAIAELIRSGTELGEASDIVFNEENSKQKSATVGILTDDLITRRAYYVHAAILALIPFKNSNLY